MSKRNTTFYQNNIIFKLMNIKYKLFSFAIILLLCLKTNAQYETNDYLKREHSLVKPYQGII